jgi:endoglucanase
MRRSMTGLAVVMATLAACGGGAAASGSTPPATAGAPPAPAPASPPPSPPPTATPASFTPGPAAIASTGPTLPLGKCVNLSNMLEPPNEGDWGRAFRDDDAANIRAAGFATVRLPVRFAGHADASPPYTIDPAFMARVRHVLETNVAAGLNVILDMHNYDALMADPAGQRDRFVALWRQVAAAFRDQPGNVWFELMNEPNNRLDDTTLPATLAPALAAVRASNPDRIVIVGGQSWSGIDSLATLAIPDDPHIVVTFHYYDPFDFTHQGADWISPVLPTGRDFGTTADNAQLDGALVKVTNFMTRTGRVPFVGEYGAYEGIPQDQRAVYYHTITSAFASIGVQSCAWGYTNTFNLWRDGTGWIHPILDGIETTTTMP